MNNKEITNTNAEEYTYLEMSVDDHTDCALCGTKLKFKHEADYLTMRIKEEAHCPICHIRLKAREYPLQ